MQKIRNSVLDYNYFATYTYIENILGEGCSMHHLLAEQEICVRFTFSLLVQRRDIIISSTGKKSEEKIRYQNKQ